MDQFPPPSKGHNHGQQKRPSHTSRTTPISAANVAGPQQRNTNTTFDPRHPLPPPPNYGSSVSKAPPTHAAPVNHHPETSRRPGTSSINRPPVRPVALTSPFSIEGNDPTSHPVGNPTRSQFPPQNDVRPPPLSNSWGTSIPSGSGENPVGIPSPLSQSRAQPLSPLSPGFTSTPPGSSRYSSHRSRTSDSSDEPAETFVNPQPNQPADPEVHPDYRSVRLQATLKDPASQLPGSTVEIRREKRVILEMFLGSSDESIHKWGWQGIQVPSTGSVKAAQPRLQEGLLYFSVLVYGSITGAHLSQPCEKCWIRERRALGYHPSTQPYIVDFKADNPITILSNTPDSRFLKAEVTFYFTCYTNHQHEAYELVVELRDKHHLLVARSPLPYQFTSVPKKTNPGAMPSQHTPGQQHANHQPQAVHRDHSVRPQDRHPVPSIPTPRSEHESHGYSVLPQPYVPPDTNQNTTLLERLAPSQGHVLGGFRILLSGINFPSPPPCIYAKFGSLVTGTVWYNPFTLECLLPSSPHSGIVRVSLSLYSHPEGPTLGESNCWFNYTSDRECICAFLPAMSTQDRSTSFVTSDHLLPQLPPNLSSDSCTLVHHMAQSKGHFAQISANKMENLAFHFLASLTSLPSWRDTISFVNDHHQTLAHLAVLFRYTALLEKLVEWGVDLDVQDLNGFTALHCAYLCKDWECVRILRCAGVDEDLEDKLGRLPVDIHSPPASYTRASTPSSDETSSSAQISSGWEDVPDVASHPSSFKVSRIIAKGQPGSEIHTSDLHSRDRPLAVSLSSPSSEGSNKSWVKAPERDVQVSNPPIDLSHSPPSQYRQPVQTSQPRQHAAPYLPVTSTSTGPSHPHGPTREQVAAHYPSPMTPISDLTSSLSSAGSLFPRRSNYSSSDTSSVHPSSHCVSPMSTPSPMPPETPLQTSWSHLNPPMHRPESSAWYFRNMLHSGSEAKIQPSPSPGRTGSRFGPAPQPLPSWAQSGAFLDEKAQKGDSGRKEDIHGELASPNLSLPTTAPYNAVESRKAQQAIQEPRPSRGRDQRGEH